MILGVDVFGGYGRIDWDRVAASGVQFAYIKCTEGNDVARDDRRYGENIAGAKAAGLYVGSYHFAYPLPDDAKHPGRSPEDQARRAYITSGQMGTRPGELPPAIDLEWPELGEWGKWGVTAASISEWAHRYCVEAERLWQRKPLLYTYPFFWHALASSSSVAWAKDYPLWVASYKDIAEWSPKPETSPHVLAPWDGDWTFWQFSADKSPIAIPGIKACPVDRDVFRGDIDELRQLAGIDPGAPTTPVLVPEARPDPLGQVAVIRPRVPLRGDPPDPDDAA